MSMLEVSEIRKSFGTLEVLKSVDLTVNKGDVVAILGPSGSGKTTLLRCVNFLERADAGTLTFDGERFDLGKIKNSDIARLRKKTAFVFQNYNLFLNKTAIQNVAEGLMTARKMSKDDAFSKAEEALRRVGMLDRRDHYPNQLSGGQQQRVAIGRALIMRPALVLADEPTGNLDSRSSQDVMDLLCKASDHYQQTVLMITHNMNLTLSADRVFQVTDGLLEELGNAGRECGMKDEK